MRHALPVSALLVALVAAAPGPDGSLPGAQQAPAVSEEEAPRTRVVLLGTGTPNADPDRSGPALAVVVDDTPYLVDAGPGVVRRAAAAREAGVEALEVSRLATVFLTHLHSDHTAGLPDLLLTPWTLGRDRPLRMVGPEGTEEMARRIREAYRRDILIRVEGLEPTNDRGHRVEAGDVEPGVVYRDERVTVTAFPVAHGSWDQAFGYRFDTPDRTVVISGDTSPTEEIVRQCRECDILVHEVYAEAGFRGRSPDWQRYHSRFHTSGPELGRIAARARPGLLVLTHQLLWGAAPEQLLEEIEARFDGRVVYGRDLDVF